jgi:hypothetical protein
MPTEPKTPLQAVVAVICDCLCDLPPEDQARALEAARVTLGLRSPGQAARQAGVSPTLPSQRPAQDWEAQAPRLPLPMVRVEMMNDRPVVIDRPAGQSNRVRSLVVVNPRQLQPLRQLPSPRRDAVAQVPASGYVRSIR